VAAPRPLNGCRAQHGDAKCRDRPDRLDTSVRYDASRAPGVKVTGIFTSPLAQLDGSR